ncbi:FAD-dependent monooxygenase [Glaciecola sp. 1036]|uniref:FAD-dependent monooxygenase n=1 Tax=Alteromonadaceae TaxID=72275 RepID=UPI003D00E5D7
MPAKKMQNTDVLIVGGGIVGGSLAIDLAEAGFSVTVVDFASAVTTDIQPKVFSARVSAISAASEAYFRKLNIWQNIQRKQAYTDMQVWDKDGFGQIEFSAQEMQSEHLGHIIENDLIVAALNDKMATMSNIQLLLGVSVEQIQEIDAGYSLQLSNQQQITGSLLVGADGANSQIKAQMGFSETFWDYEHTAIVANVRTEIAHDNTARQGFTPFGPLAFLPLADPFQCSIVWSQKTKRASELLGLSEDEFCKALLVDIDNQLGLVSLTTERFSFPLRMRYTRQWTKLHVALVGDAAHTIHPLAGQGANLGLSDAQTLAELLIQSKDKYPVGHNKILRNYERKQKAEAMKTIATMEGFKQLFDGDNPMKKLVRNLGLLAANKVSPVKEFFIKQAAGN